MWLKDHCDEVAAKFKALASEQGRGFYVGRHMPLRCLLPPSLLPIQQCISCHMAITQHTPGLDTCYYAYTYYPRTTAGIPQNLAGTYPTAMCVPQARWQPVWTH